MRKLLFASLVKPILTEVPPPADADAVDQLAEAVARTARKRLGRSLSIREVDAGSSNAAELEIHALNSVSASASSPRRGTQMCCW
jgi:hypothetical protein